MNNDVKIFGGMILATVILIVGAIFFLSRGGNSSNPNNPQSAPTVIPKDEIIKEDNWSVGSESAKVTVVEFGDFECPSCKNSEPIIKDLISHYGDKILFVYRHFPLAQIHQYALSSADAAEAAGMQGKFWEYKEELYKISPDLTEENLIKIAKDLKLDEKKFVSDMKSDAARQKVLNDMADGNSFGVAGTPTFFINGKQLQLGRLPTLSDFKAEIDPLLKN